MIFILPFIYLLIFIHLFIYLFLAALGLCCCLWAFSSCGEQGLLFVAVHRLLIVVASRCGAQAVGTRASVVVARGLSSCGLRAYLLHSMWDLPGPGLDPCPLHWQADP